MLKNSTNSSGRRGYRNRSEAVRGLLRSRLESFRQERNESGYCVASLTYVYNHHERDLAERLTQLQHDHHELALSTMHAHLDHETCIECVFLKGETVKVRAFAEVLMAQCGVMHGQLNLVSSDGH